MDPFLLRAALGFLVGGVWITLTSIAAESLGSKVGGFLGGLPSTIVVALAFIAWTQGTRRAYDATTALPVAFAINCVFLIVYAVLVPRGLLVGLGGAMLAWLGLQSLLVAWAPQDYRLALGVWAVTLVGAYLVVDRVLRLRSHGRVAVRRSVWDVAARAVLSGGIIVLAVTLSRLGGPVLGAAMAAFPAVYVSTLYITARSAGVAFSRALVVPLMVSAVVNCVVFGSAFRAAVVRVELPAAVGAAYVASLVSASLTYAFLRGRRG